MKQLNRNIVEVTTYNELTKDLPILDKEGREVGMKVKVVKRFLPMKMTFYKENCLPSEFLTRKGKPSVNKCFIFDEASKSRYLIKGSYMEAVRFFCEEGHKTVMGFRK